MYFLVQVFTGLLTAYLSFTNFLALQINQFINPELYTNETTSISPAILFTENIATLPSYYSYTDIIPDILIKSRAYQQASLIESVDTIPVTTKDPLEALVNIYCTFTTDKYIRTTTGTGFFVSPLGVILTNAHVAQFFLLEKANVSGETACTIRSGNPATPKYTAKLLYISPAWIQKHAALIDDTMPTGTGERDYALLYVDATVDGEQLNASFPSIETNTELLPRSITGTTITAAGYPAEHFLNGETDTGLTPQEASSTITELYTFGSKYADIFSITGSTIGEHGSSGGPIIAADGRVIGMISTRGDDARDGAGSLRAITLSYINRTITEETGFSFANNVNGNLPYRSQVFTETLAPFLTQLLAAEVSKNQ